MATYLYPVPRRAPRDRGNALPHGPELPDGHAFGPVRAPGAALPAFDATVLHSGLFLFGFDLLAASIVDTTSAEKARWLAGRIRGAAARLDARRARSGWLVPLRPIKPFGKTSGGVGARVAAHVAEQMRRGADWYAAIARSGLGVRVESRDDLET